MYEVVRQVELKPEPVCLDSIPHISNSRIIVCEKITDPACQSVLVCEKNGAYYWNNFYVKTCPYRTRYDSVKEAIASRFEKSYRVFILDNKTQLKQFIKTR